MPRTRIIARYLPFATLICLVLLAGCQPMQSAALEENTPIPLIPTSTAVPTSTPTVEIPTPTQAPEPPPIITIPELTDPAPEINGTISPGEWEQARVETFADGSELMLMHTRDFLYLAIRASTPQMIVGNVYIQRENEVSILHASAALGTAIYHKGDQAWEQTQDFTWQCRDAGFGDEAMAKRAEFLQLEGWLASITRLGRFNEMEYQIEVGEGITTLAVVFLQNHEANPYPVTLADDCVQLFSGGIPEEMRFSTGLWVPISLSTD